MAKVAEIWRNKKGETIRMLSNAFADTKDEAERASRKNAKVREELEGISFILQAINGIGPFYEHTYQLKDDKGNLINRWRSYIAENLGKIDEPEAENHPVLAAPKKGRKAKVA